MFSKPLEKYINSLRVKKQRNEQQCFIAEGEKTVSEFLNSRFQFEKIFFTEACSLKSAMMKKVSEENLIVVNDFEMKKISELKSPSTILAVIKMPSHSEAEKNITSGLHLVLDGIQDPGNLGTIIRIADWFGIETVFCSGNCVDIYNGKVVQAAMGSHAHLNVQEQNIEALLSKTSLPKILTVMESESTIYNSELPNNAFIIIGSEGSGVSENITALCTQTISIPRMGNAESLNAAVATGIICAAMRGKKIN